MKLVEIKYNHCELHSSSVNNVQIAVDVAQSTTLHDNIVLTSYGVKTTSLSVGVLRAHVNKSITSHLNKNSHIMNYEKGMFQDVTS